MLSASLKPIVGQVATWEIQLEELPRRSDAVVIGFMGEQEIHVDFEKLWDPLKLESIDSPCKTIETSLDVSCQIYPWTINHQPSRDRGRSLRLRQCLRHRWRPCDSIMKSLKFVVAMMVDIYIYIIYIILYNDNDVYNIYIYIYIHV